VSPEHLTLALVTQEGGVVGAILERLQIDPLPLTNRLETAISRLPKTQQAAEPSLSRPLVQILEAAMGQARFFKDDFVSTEHILAGVLEATGTEASKILRDAGLDRDKLLTALQDVRGSQRVTDQNQNPEGKY
jgi:ATP-dependent Clp protease ATP-binding subunit ClpB